jgi:hypothetical protein
MTLFDEPFDPVGGVDLWDEVRQRYNVANSWATLALHVFFEPNFFDLICVSHEAQYYLYPISQCSAVNNMLNSTTSIWK